jgi:hypothetical protein
MPINHTYTAKACETGTLISFTGITDLYPNHNYTVYFWWRSIIPNGLIVLNPSSYSIRPINQSPITIHTYAKILTNLNLDNSSSSIIGLSIVDENNNEVYENHCNIRCGNLCLPSGIPGRSDVAARLPTNTPTNTPTPSVTPTITPTISLTASNTPTPTSTIVMSTPTPTPSVSRGV